ncbi:MULTISPECIES: SdrD B-like domain-containing protein [unclassified Micromonospora]|uniref:SdrD B-like domain-containing protein n=1 Tax=unclassified Micromonospora TaxID=2617518 RepID=UPI002FF02517
MRILHARSGAALALVALSTTLGSVAVASPASAAPERADLTVGLTVDRSRIPVQGEVVKTDIKVANAGVATADGITVTVDLPADAYVSGEGPALDSWQCSALSPRMVCAHAALAPGQSADPFTVGIRFRPGTDGQTGDITATVSTTSRESSTRNNSATQTVTHDASVIYPDLYVSSVAPLSYEVIEGDWVKYPMHFSNRGTGTAQDVRVRVAAPAGPLGGVGDQSDPSWQCTTVVTDQEWECVNGPLAPGEQTPLLSFSGRVPAGGQPGDQLPVSITVSTSTPEEDPRGNTYEAAFVYVTPAYLTGRIWLDADADGQRDPEESEAPAGVGLAVQPYSGFTRSDVTVNADGTYRLALHDGQHRLLASLVSTTHRFTTPDVGDDATDSDVFVTYDSLEQQEAQSDDVFLVQGAETVLDIGLVSVG